MLFIWLQLLSRSGHREALFKRWAFFITTSPSLPLHLPAACLPVGRAGRGERVKPFPLGGK